ncbi:MAG: hypothetical protein KF795_09520 [Labilithrix sp.]|nr:hypothetical protein [Labilithrix sp.]
MNRWISLGALVAAVTVVSVAACGDDDASDANAADGGPTTTPTTTPTTAPTDGGRTPDGATPDAGRRSCLDRPDTLARPPATVLPCELIPPGLTL